MKNWKKAALGALCAVSLLAGCGTQNGRNDEKQSGDNGTDQVELTTAAVREINAPAKLLEK